MIIELLFSVLWRAAVLAALWYGAIALFKFLTGVR